MRRKYDWRKVKIRRSYNIAEAAELLEVIEGTIYRWFKKGLPHSERPILIKGADLREWVKNINASYKRKVGPGRFYCLRCQAGRAPAGMKVAYRTINNTRGSAVGRCEVCGIEVRKAVSLKKLAEQMPGVEISFE